MYLEKLLAVFEEVRRVLRDDGTCWVNMGDGYWNNAATESRDPAKVSAGVMGYNGAFRDRLERNTGIAHKRAACGLKPKDLIGQPWRLAFALRDAGWYLRSEIIWAKPNPMPESVTDRPTKSHEQIFLLTKSARYFYDAEAVREAGTRTEWSVQKFKGGDLTRHHLSGIGPEPGDPEAGRNLRSVWSIPSAPFPDAHFATFPPALVIPCIKAGTSERGACPECGAAWVRVVERTTPDDAGRPATAKYVGASGLRRDDTHRLLGEAYQKKLDANPPKTLGFRPACDHGRDPVPCRVLDPFFGAGTTGLVSDRLGRDCTGIELNPAYAAMAEKRLRADCPMFTKVEVTP